MKMRISAALVVFAAAGIAAFYSGSIKRASYDKIEALTHIARSDSGWLTTISNILIASPTYGTADDPPLGFFIGVASIVIGLMLLLLAVGRSVMAKCSAIVIVDK